MMLCAATTQVAVGIQDTLCLSVKWCNQKKRFCVPCLRCFLGSVLQFAVQIEYNTLEGRIGEAGVSGVVMKQNFDLTDALRQETTYSEKVHAVKKAVRWRVRNLMSLSAPILKSFR